MPPAFHPNVVPASTGPFTRISVIEPFQDGHFPRSLSKRQTASTGAPTAASADPTAGALRSISTWAMVHSLFRR